MNENLISFKTAVLAKKKGFTNIYDEFHLISMFKSENEGMTGILIEELQGNERRYDYLAPPQSELQKWLREKHLIHICIVMYPYQADVPKYGYMLLSLSSKNMGERLLIDPLIFNTYELALEEGLLQALNLLSNE